MPLYETLYKLNTDGKTIQEWNIYVANDFTSYHTIYGQQDGKMVETKPTTIIPKVNRTQEEQCMSEVSSKIKSKTDKKYVKDIKDVSTAGERLPGYDAMLAKSWTDHSNKIEYPCSAQPKLDGFRCLATSEGMFSRNRKPFSSCKHIQRELDVLFKDHPTLLLDGELYSHDHRDNFDAIASAVSKTEEKASKEDIELQKLLSYNVYDSPSINGLTASDPFESRIVEVFKLLNEYDFKYIIPVSTSANIETPELLETLKESFINSGYEGLMVRNKHMKYSPKRTSDLLKMKTFMDDEFEIIGFEEGKGNLVGHIGKFWCVTLEGVEFKAPPDGPMSRKKWLFENPDEFVGKMTTVQFQNLTPSGKPRFPVSKNIRGLSDKSDWI